MVDKADLQKTSNPPDGIFKDVDPILAIFSAVIIFAFVLIGVVAPDALSKVFSFLQEWIQVNLNWYYVLATALFTVVVFWLSVSKYGKIVLGQEGDTPEFTNIAWFAMLFGTSMGIGLLFWSIAEPLYHIQVNPLLLDGEAGTLTGGHKAMQITFLHWGLQAWSVYTLVGLTLAYFAYRKGLPLTIRSALYPIFGNRIYGPIGHAADLLAIFGTTFGIATTMGLGVGQILAGLNHLFGIPDEPWIKIVLLMVTAVIATFSAVTGVSKGIKILSEINLYVSAVLLLIILLVGPTVFTLGLFSTNVGTYLSDFIEMGLWVDIDDDPSWQGAWTIFYWGWWVAWSPFVGVFYARISRGRTIREFCFGTLIMPVLLTFFWMSIFGGTALYQELFGPGNLITAVNEDIALPLWIMIENFDIGFLGDITAYLCIFLIFTYFVTSADSATLVITTIISSGNESPPKLYRIFWGLAIGATAAVLLYSGGLKALQTASLVAGLPFSMIVFLMVYGLMKELSKENLSVIHETSPDSE